MALKIPTLKEITDRLTARIEQYLGIGDQRPTRRLARKVTQVIGIVVGGAIYLLYLFLQEVMKQQFVNTADEDSLYALGDEYGVPRKPADYARGDVVFVGEVTGEDPVIVPTGTQLQSSSGIIYETTEEIEVPEYTTFLVTFDYTTNTVLEPDTERKDGDRVVFLSLDGTPTGIDHGKTYFVRDSDELTSFKIAETLNGAAVNFTDNGTGDNYYAFISAGNVQAVDTGSAGNQQPREFLYFLSKLTGVEDTAVVGIDGLYGGADLEELDDWRERIALRKKTPPSGGSRGDYKRWALEVPGVTRVWVFGAELLYAGRVSVAFVRDAEDPIIPSAADRQEMKDYLIRHTDPATGIEVGIPITDETGLDVPELTPIDVEATIGLPEPEYSSPKIQADIIEAIREYVRTEGGPTETLYSSRLSNVISSVAGEYRHTIISFPLNKISFSETEIGVVDPTKITFTETV